MLLFVYLFSGGNLLIYLPKILTDFYLYLRQLLLSFHNRYKSRFIFLHKKLQLRSLSFFFFISSLGKWNLQISSSCHFSLYFWDFFKILKKFSKYCPYLHNKIYLLWESSYLKQILVYTAQFFSKILLVSRHSAFLLLLQCSFTFFLTTKFYYFPDQTYELSLSSKSTLLCI